MVRSRAFRWLFAASPWMFVKTAVRNGYRRRAPAPAQLADYIAACRTPRLLASTLAFLATYPAELPAIDAGLAAMSVPTLLLWGGGDVYVPPSNATRCTRACRTARSRCSTASDTSVTTTIRRLRRRGHRLVREALTSRAHADLDTIRATLANELAGCRVTKVARHFDPARGLPKKLLRATRRSS